MNIHEPLQTLHPRPAQYDTDPSISTQTTPPKRQALPMQQILRQASVSITHALCCPVYMAPTTQSSLMPCANSMAHTAVWPSLTQIISPTRLWIRFRRLVFGAVSSRFCPQMSFVTLFHNLCWDMGFFLTKSQAQEKRRGLR